MDPSRILVVDDDPDNRAMVGHFLRNWGYEVEDAPDGRRALEKIGARPPHLVLLDLEMPGMDGYETCARLRSDPATEAIPIVIFTGLEQMPRSRRSLEDGADDYVVKTAEPRELRARIDQVLARSRRMDAIGREAGAAADGSEDPPALSLSLAEVSLSEAIQRALRAGGAGVAELSRGELTGSIYLSEGEIVHAATGDRRGEEAFYGFALWADGRFDYRPGRSAPERTLHAPARSLLVEASRRSDAWRVISSRVPSFDLVPRCVPLSQARSIQLTRSDWAVLRRADGERSIADIVDAIDTDLFEAGRVIFSLVTVGVLKLEAPGAVRTSEDDAVPRRGDAPALGEPFALSAEDWEILARVDGRRSLREVRKLVALDPESFAERVRALRDGGFLVSSDPA